MPCTPMRMKQDAKGKMFRSGSTSASCPAAATASPKSCPSQNLSASSMHRAEPGVPQGSQQLPHLEVCREPVLNPSPFGKGTAAPTPAELQAVPGPAHAPDCLGLIIPHESPASAVPRSDTKPTQSSSQAWPAPHPCTSLSQQGPGCGSAPSVLRSSPCLTCGSYTSQFCLQSFLPYKALTSLKTAPKPRSTYGAHSTSCSSSWQKQGFLQAQKGPWMYMADPPGTAAISKAEVYTDPTTLLSLKLFTSLRHFLPMCDGRAHHMQALSWECSWNSNEGSHPAWARLGCLCGVM